MLIFLRVPFQSLLRSLLGLFSPLVTFFRLKLLPGFGIIAVAAFSMRAAANIFSLVNVPAFNERTRVASALAFCCCFLRLSLSLYECRVNCTASIRVQIVWNERKAALLLRHPRSLQRGSYPKAASGRARWALSPGHHEDNQIVTTRRAPPERVRTAPRLDGRRLQCKGGPTT